MTRSRQARMFWAGGVLVMAALVVGRHALQRRAFVYLVLHKPAPTEKSMTEVVERSGLEPAEAVERLWSSGKLPQRHFALTYLRDNEKMCAAGWGTFREIAMHAAVSGDVDLQEPAMKVLCRQEPATGAAIARELMADADPETRLTGIRCSAQTHDTAAIPNLIDLITDAERPVRSMAPMTLEQLTGHSVPIDIRDADSRASAASAWRAWYADAHHDPSPAPAGSAAKAEPPVMAVDFEMPDTSGKPLRLSDLRGRVVLLNFWTTTCGPCLGELPTLVALQSRHRDRLTVVGISGDAVPDNDDDDEDSPPKTPVSPPPDPLPAVLAVIRKNAINYPIAIDRTGVAVGAYDGSGVPLTVLIDAQGRIRRRFIGGRSLEAFERILAAIEH